GLFITVED
ncbi:hypothetical protein D030_1165B, partial [Vibrio parahaemolyticus AQ3810]